MVRAACRSNTSSEQQRKVAAKARKEEAREKVGASRRETQERAQARVYVTFGRMGSIALEPTAPSLTRSDTLPRLPYAISHQPHRENQAVSPSGPPRPTPALATPQAAAASPGPTPPRPMPATPAPAAPVVATPLFGFPPPNGVWAAPVGGHTDNGVVPHPAVAVTPYPVPGLECADVDSPTAIEAFRQLRKSNFGGSSFHQHLEIGLPYYATSSRTSIEQYHAIKSLIDKAHEALRHKSPDWPDINVICRWYTKGGQLQAHVDKVEQFTETV